MHGRHYVSGCLFVVVNYFRSVRYKLYVPVGYPRMRNKNPHRNKMSPKLIDQPRPIFMKISTYFDPKTLHVACRLSKK